MELKRWLKYLVMKDLPLFDFLFSFYCHLSVLRWILGKNECVSADNESQTWDVEIYYQQPIAPRSPRNVVFQYFNRNISLSVHTGADDEANSISIWWSANQWNRHTLAGKATPSCSVYTWALQNHFMVSRMREWMLNSQYCYRGRWYLQTFQSSSETQAMLFLIAKYILIEEMFLIYGRLNFCLNLN